MKHCEDCGYLTSNGEYNQGDWLCDTCNQYHKKPKPPAFQNIDPREQRILDKINELGLANTRRTSK